MTISRRSGGQSESGCWRVAREVWLAARCPMSIKCRHRTLVACVRLIIPTTKTWLVAGNQVVWYLCRGRGVRRVRPGRLDTQVTLEM